MTRIAVSGSHQVGKSTAISAIRDRAGVAGNVMRALSEAGLGVARETTPQTIEAYVRAQLHSEVTAASEYPDVVSDRVVLDGLAYVEAAVRRGEAVYPWSEGELVLLRASARLHAASFDIHAFIPIEFPFQSDLPFHAGGREFQREVSDLIEEYLADNWPAQVVRISGSRDQRARLMQSMIGANST